MIETKPRMRLIIFITLLLSLALIGNVFAEVIILKSGKKIEGEILEKTNEYIKVKFDNKEVYYELKYIESIKEDKESITPKENLPLDTNFYLKQGLKYGAEGNFTKAEEEFKKGLEIDSAHHNLKEALKIIDDIKKGAINNMFALLITLP